MNRPEPKFKKGQRIAIPGVITEIRYINERSGGHVYTIRVPVQEDAEEPDFIRLWEAEINED